MMTLKQIARKWLPPVLLPTAWSSPFESANWSPRRGLVPGFAPTDARNELTSSVRSELVRKSRYLHKNSGFVRELVANMAIYSTGDGIRVQAQSPDPEWNRTAEAYFALWSARCEITRRFSFEECQSLVCRGMDIDGEYFIHKTRDADGEPRIQLIESHRVGDEFGTKETIDGVGLDAWGAPIFCRVLEDSGKARDLPASSILHVHEPEWAGGVRSHPTIQHSINHALDEMELLALEKHAVKDNADISRVLKTARGELDDNGDFVVGGAAGDHDPSDPITLQKIVGGKLVALKPDESIESFQSNRPSPTFTGFLEHLRRDSALGVIPFEFAADSSKIGGAGVRLIVAKADRRFSFRQMILERRLIQPVWTYVIGDALDRGLLPPIEGWWKIGSVCPRRVSTDAGREAQQNRADVEMGLKTLSDHYAELGADFGEEILRRGADAKLIIETAAKYGVPVEMLWKPSVGPPQAQQPLTPQQAGEQPSRNARQGGNQSSKVT
jgi:capsid protein